jgi:hypothetical protein
VCNREGPKRTLALFSSFDLHAAANLKASLWTAIGTDDGAYWQDSIS